MRRLAHRPTEELLNDEVALGSAQFRFLLTIEVCVDIGWHIMAAEGLSAADTYADVFTDDAEIVKALQHNLGDLDIFRQQIAEFVLRN